MKRYDTRIEDGRISLETDDGWIDVGTTADVVDLVGETYTIEYDDRAATMAWLDTDDEGRMTFDVLDTIESTTHSEEFVRLLRDAPLDADEGEVPARTELFVDLLTSIWDGKGRPTRE